MFTTYRLTEHHTAGGMSRWTPYLSELQPEMFCEISPELAEQRGLTNEGWATIISPRAAIECRVLVTERMRPLTVGGRTVHQVGLPYHWGVGSDAVVTGDAANDLIGVTLDPNTQIQESKVGSCDIRAGRRPRGEELLRMAGQRLVAAAVHQLQELGGELDVAQATGAELDAHVLLAPALGLALDAAAHGLHVVDECRVHDGQRGSGGGVPGLVGARPLQQVGIGVDAISELSAERGDDVGHARRRRPATRPTVTATTA